MKKHKVTGLPTPSPIPTAAKASTKMSLELGDIKVSHEEAVELIGECRVSEDEGSEGGVRDEEVVVVEEGAYSKGDWDNRAKENLVPFGSIFKGASEEKLASATVFLLGLVGNLTDLKAAKIVGLLLGNDDGDKSAKEGM